MITEYHRPLTIEEALALASLPDAVILAGGTTVNASRDGSPMIAVDLQALSLSGIRADRDSVRMGATTRIQEVVDADQVPDVLRDLARREVPSILRNAATVGGTVGTADPESQFLAGLLAFGATVTLARVGSESDHPLEELLDDPGQLGGAIITNLTVPRGGSAAADRTARTPMDQPIVMAVAHKAADGAVRLAMTGVAPRPLIVDPDRVGELDPPSDFRGSSTYRAHIASVLAGRVLHAIGGPS